MNKPIQRADDFEKRRKHLEKYSDEDKLIFGSLRKGWSTP